MKILYIHQYFNTHSMNGGVRSYDIALNLVRKGHDVCMITTWREKSSSNEWIYSNEDGIDVHWLPLEYSNNLNYLSRILVFLRFAWRSYFYAKKFDCDLVFATSTPLTVAIPALLLSFKKSIPMVFEVRDLWPNVAISVGALKNPVSIFFAKLLEKVAYKKSEAVIALSPGMKSGIIKTGYSEKRVAVITNFSNISLFNVPNSFGMTFRSSRKCINSRPLIVYTGAFGLINGLSYLIDLASELKSIESDVAILIVGQGREHEKLVNYSKNKNVLGKNFFIEGQFKKSELPHILSAANLACNIVIENPDVWDNSANKFFDALASGTPLLVNDSGWQADLIKNTSSGIASNGMPMAELAKLVDNRLHDEKWKIMASKNAKKLAIEYFDKDILVNKVEDILFEAKNKSGINVSKIGIDNFLIND